MDDLISRQAAIDAICKACANGDDYVECVERRPGSTFCDEIVALRKVPSAEPECNLDEWCHDCKEYDHDKHCCPRWNRVIRTALEEAQPERKRGKWVGVKEYCDHLNEKAEREGKGYRFIPSGMNNCVYCNQCWESNDRRTTCCPNCGADMRGGEE